MTKWPKNDGTTDLCCVSAENSFSKVRGGQSLASQWKSTAGLVTPAKSIVCWEGRFQNDIT